MKGPARSALIEGLLRDLRPRVLGAVVKRFGDFAAAEDAVQDASLAALVQWPRDGMPSDPGAWLMRVAVRRMADHFRSESARRARENDAGLGAARDAASPGVVDASNPDETLALLLMCCHPALTHASAVALTLRAVGGLTTREIAHAFFVPEPTMAQRIGRAKQTVKDSGIPFELPHGDERPQRFRAVLQVLHLIFNEGYTATMGPGLQRADLAHEAIRLTRLVHVLEPEDTEVAGLLALMLLTDARRLARATKDGALVPLARQDRSLWDKDQIAEGVKLISATLPRGSIGPYQLKAAIAAVHDEAARAEDTDWPQILALYTLLRRLSDNPMIALNQAIAVAMVHGPAKGLEWLEEIKTDAYLAEHHRWDAVRAHLMEMTGDREAAVRHYRAAAARTGNLAERNYLLTQAAKLCGDV